MEGQCLTPPAGPSGQPPLWEPEPEASTVTMVTTTLHPVGPDDSLSFCNPEGFWEGGWGQECWVWPSQPNLFLFLSNLKSDPFPRVHLRCLNKSSAGRSWKLPPPGPEKQQRWTSLYVGGPSPVLSESQDKGSGLCSPKAGAQGCRSRFSGQLLQGRVHMHPQSTCCIPGLGSSALK